MYRYVPLRAYSAGAHGLVFFVWLFAYVVAVRECPRDDRCVDSMQQFAVAAGLCVAFACNATSQVTQGWARGGERGATAYACSPSFILSPQQDLLRCMDGAAACAALPHTGSLQCPDTLVPACAGACHVYSVGFSRSNVRASLRAFRVTLCTPEKKKMQHRVSPHAWLSSNNHEPNNHNNPVELVAQSLGANVRVPQRRLLLRHFPPQDWCVVLPLGPLLTSHKRLYLHRVNLSFFLGFCFSFWVSCGMAGVACVTVAPFPFHGNINKPSSDQVVAFWADSRQPSAQHAGLTWLTRARCCALRALQRTQA